MKKILLSIIAVVSLSTIAMSQIEIYEFGSTTEISGTEIAKNGFQGIDLHTDFYVKNASGSSVVWKVTRVRMNEVAEWEDYLCWGGAFGACYPITAMDETNWVTPVGDNQTVAAGDTAILNSHVITDAYTPGDVVYRYYIGTTFSPQIAYVDVRVYISVGLDEVAPELSVSIAPNPSNESFVVSATGSKTSSIKVVDVLGNVILSEEMNYTSKKVDVSNFRNGVYFVIIESNEAKPVTKRIVVRH